MPITFGSVGDILSVCLIVKDLVAALDDSRGSSAEYREVIRELWGLDRALLEVDLLSRTCENTIEMNALFSAARKAADDCRKSVALFSKKIKKYGASLDEGSSTNFLRDTAMKIKWVTRKDDLAKFRAEVNAHSSSINMLLATASVKILKVKDEKLNARLANSEEISKAQGSLIVEVRDRLVENNRLISAGNAVATRIADKLRLDWFRQLGSELKNLMERIFTMNVATYKAVIAIQSGGFPSALERTLVQEPFVLEDAIGRISPVHMQFISSWNAFDAVLEMRFQNMQGHKKVQNKEYVIQEHSTRREIRRNFPWEASFLPGQRVDMSLIFEKEERGKTEKDSETNCPRCQTVSTGLQDADIQCSNCSMWFRRMTEYKDVEPTPVNIPSIPKASKAVFGQHGFGSVVFGPPKPNLESASTSKNLKRKLGETDLEDTENVAYFKRVRLITKQERVKHHPGPFAEHTIASNESVLNPKAKQDAEEREARLAFEQKAAVLGMNDPQTLDCLNTLAWCLRNRRKFSKAETLFRAAFDSSRNTLVLDDPDRLQALARNLMTVLMDQNKTTETGEIWEITRCLLESNLPAERAGPLIERLKLAYAFQEEPENDMGSRHRGWKGVDRGIASDFPVLHDSIAMMQFPDTWRPPSVRSKSPSTEHSKENMKFKASDYVYSAVLFSRQPGEERQQSPTSNKVSPPTTESLNTSFKKTQSSQGHAKGQTFEENLAILRNVLSHPFQGSGVEQQVSQINEMISSQVLQSKPQSQEHHEVSIYLWNDILDLFHSVILYSQAFGIFGVQAMLHIELSALESCMYAILKEALGVRKASVLWLQRTLFGSPRSFIPQLPSSERLEPVDEECNAIGILLRQSLKTILKATNFGNETEKEYFPSSPCLMTSPVKGKFTLRRCYYYPSSEALIEPVVGESLIDLYYLLDGLQNRVQSLKP